MPRFCRPYVHRFLALKLALVVLVLGVVATTPASAKAGAHQDPRPIAAGPILNAPQAFSRRHTMFPDEVKRAIRATRRGDTIRAAYYRFDLASVSNQLIAAHRRGVNVQLVLNRPKAVNRGMAREIGRLATALGISAGGGSFVVSPASSGFGATGNMHAKFLTIDRAGGQRYLTFVGSANLNHGNTTLSWNETQVVVGDAKIYAALGRYFRDIVAGQDHSAYYRKVTSRGLTLHLYPGAPNVVGRALARVKVKPGCRVSIASYLWADNRLADARRVARLAERGCVVRVLVNDNPQHLGPRVSRTLRHSRVEIRNLSIRRKGVTTGVHAKTWIINGTVYAGSANTSDVTRRRNADIITVRTSRDPAGRAALAAYERWMDQMWQVAQPLYQPGRPPASSARPSARPQR